MCPPEEPSRSQCANLGPATEGARTFVDWETIRAISRAEVDADTLVADLDAAEAPLDPVDDDPWRDS